MITVQVPEVEDLQARTDYEQIVQGKQGTLIENAQPQSSINLELTAEQSLIDLNFDTSPVGTEDMMLDQVELLEPQSTEVGLGHIREIPQSLFRNLNQQPKNQQRMNQQPKHQPSRRVCLIKPGVRRVISSIECGGHQVMTEMKCCTENTIIPSI